jgi:predicted lipoprotein with Yx(FWY)xxD motif
MGRLPTLVLAAAVLLTAGCGSDDDSGRAGAAPETTAETATEPAPTRTEPRKAEPARARGTTIRLASSQYGKVLFDRAGQAIYLFDKERSDRSRCYGACAEAWPPVLTKGEPRAGRGIDERLLGTTRRRDGKRQVTYNDHPLYFYAHEGRNEVRCHNVREFGGLWLVLNGDGDALD